MYSFAPAARDGLSGPLEAAAAASNGPDKWGYGSIVYESGKWFAQKQEFRGR
ncbi:hypothetical protein KDA_32230 [Dictyobacter alpinus]|uniref:Uncharacterized protein n=1 Tax=Dictyobacter alpinus TaxID=2014873 RepID=A0A402B8T5_9CHLR|nr:hypothetical protein KDA_32230 [Dictyobacter alpinus]